MRSIEFHNRENEMKEIMAILDETRSIYFKSVLISVNQCQQLILV